MNSAFERLVTLRAGDVMNPRVVQLSPHQTMEEAARVLAEHHVTGAPVVDELGHCVGVLSGTDFVNRDSQRARAAERALRCDPRHRLAQADPDSPWQVIDACDGMVASHMSPQMESVSCASPLVEVARRMCQAHVHRVLVTDEDGRPAGIVSLFDVVAAMTQAVDEWIVRNEVDRSR